MRRLSDLLDAGLKAVRDQTHAYATAEKNYRQTRAAAWVEVKTLTMLAKEKEDEVDARSADARYARDLADGMRQAALEAVRSRRAQLSALQSLLGAHRAEAEFARTGPRYET